MASRVNHDHPACIYIGGGHPIKIWVLKDNYEVSKSMRLFLASIQSKDLEVEHLRVSARTE